MTVVPLLARNQPGTRCSAPVGQPAERSMIQSLIDRGALFIINHSGGKDSQAMTLKMVGLVPRRQLLVIHADLPGVDWEGLQDHIDATAFGLPVVVARAGKTFMEMVEHRGMFPSPANRQCTSDLKRGPIAKVIRSHLKAHPEFGGLVVSCMGMRAEESAGRSRLPVLTANIRGSIAGREWWDWLPIHDWSEVQVFAAIEAAGQEPLWVYRAGMSRASCRFCIMASDADHRVAARIAPGAYRIMVETERRLNFTLSMSRRPLTEITGIAA